MVKEFRDPPPRPRNRALVMPEVKAAKPDHQDRTEVLMAILQEQRQTNQLLMMLIDALGEDSPDPDAEPQTYMDGSPV